MRTRRLIVQAPEGERELLFVGRLTVGRAPECDISVADSKISRRHAEFDATGPVPRVADLGSRNGLLVNGRKVAGADLSPGDVVTIGDLRVRFEETLVATAAPAPAPVTSDRTAVLPIPSAFPVAPDAVDDVPPSPAPVPVEDRTAVLPGPVAAARKASPPSSPAPSHDTGDRTAVIPRPLPPEASGAARADAPPAAAGPVSAAAPIPPPPVAAPAPSSGDRAARAAAPAPPPPAPTPPAASSAVQAATAAPASTAAGASPAAGAVAAAGPSVPAMSGTRFSWAGLVLLVCVGLGGLGVLLGALPLMSTASTAVDQLSRRQVRTLGGWAASAVRADGAVDEAVIADVLAQPGVESVLVLHAGTGRVMAPTRLLGRSFDALPVVGAEWKNLTAATVTVTGSAADAFVPVSPGSQRYLAWVRYVPPSAGENGIAVVVGLIATLGLAMLAAMLIRRQTASSMQHFTRQVELAVSGANPKVMDSRLLPGIERLPGIVSYLLEHRRHVGGATTQGGAATGSGSVAAIEPQAPPEPVGPAWIEATPSLSVVATSAHAPGDGVRDWASASGRHLLDVLEPGPVCNAVVQGLGALGMAAGAHVVVPVADRPPVTLRREASTHVRVELETN